MQSKTDRQKTGNSFLGRAHDVTQSHLCSMQTKIKNLKKAVLQIEDKYQAQVSSIQYGTVNAHHKLISEVRAVLKTLAKVCVSFNSSGNSFVLLSELTMDIFF